MAVSDLVQPTNRHRVIPDVEPGLTMDENLTAFLERWESSRAALIKKYQSRVDHYRHKHGMGLVYESELRTLRHYQHEAAMLEELRKRALDP